MLLKETVMDHSGKHDPVPDLLECLAAQKFYVNDYLLKTITFLNLNIMKYLVRKSVC